MLFSQPIESWASFFMIGAMLWAVIISDENQKKINAFFEKIFGLIFKILGYVMRAILAWILGIKW